MTVLPAIESEKFSLNQRPLHFSAFLAVVCKTLDLHTVVIHTVLHGNGQNDNCSPRQPG
jgi:hypothetical protein